MIKNIISGGVLKLGFSNFIYLLFNFVIIKYLTNHYSPAVFGKYSIIIAFSSIVFILIQTVTSIVGPLYKEKQFSKLEIRIKCFNLLILFILIILFILSIFVAFSFIVKFNYIFEIILATFLGVSISFNMLSNSIILVEGYINRFIFFNLLNPFFRVLIISLIIYYKFKFSINEIIGFFIFSNLIISILGLYHYIKLFKVKKYSLSIDNTFLKEYLSYTRFNLFNNLISWLNIFSDKYILGRTQGTSLVGVYSLQYQYSFSVFNQLSQVIGQYFNSFYWVKTITDELDKIKLIIKLLSISIILITSFIILIPNHIIDFFIINVSSENFIGFRLSYKMILISGLLFMSTQIISNPLLKKNEIKSLSVSKGITFISFLFLAVFLTPKFSITGLSISLLISNLIYYLLIIRNVLISRIEKN